MNKKSIIYVNYSPYENSGHILDYLLENFEKVYLMSISFHVLGTKDEVNKFTFYENGKLVTNEYLFGLTIPEQLVFFLLPIRSFINALQIALKVFLISKRHGKIDIFFTVNAFTATIGRILKALRLVDTTIFWVWDYYPITNTNFFVKIMRQAYWQLDKFATYSDRVIYLHERLAEVRKSLGVIKNSQICRIVPIGTGELYKVKKKNLHNIRLGFIGVLKESQGLDMLLHSAPVLSKHFPKLTFDIIGSGPDGARFKKRARENTHITYNFYGLVSERKFQQILYNATIGIAPYKPGDNTVSKYTDPGKPKRYIEFNLPTITTDVIGISQELKRARCGEVIEYGDYDALVKAIKKIIGNYDTYVDNVIRLHQKYYYKKIYADIFAG